MLPERRVVNVSKPIHPPTPKVQGWVLYKQVFCLRAPNKAEPDLSPSEEQQASIKCCRGLGLFSPHAGQGDA